MWWHDSLPTRLFFSFGPFHIYYYGLIVAIAILIAVFYAQSKFANKPKINTEQSNELFFYLVLFAIIGARFYHVLFFNWAYYQDNFLEIFQIWQGGLAIQGAILASLFTLYFWSKKYQLKFYQLSDWLAPALILGQVIGRWGNYFNQELFGKPLEAWYAIQISLENRVVGFENFTYFHPTFFYESILNFCLFLILYFLSKKKLPLGTVTWLYLGGYSLIRFSLEFVRIDPTPLVFGMRLPQVVSLAVVFLSIFFIIKKLKTNK